MLQLGSLLLESPLVLAPLAGYTDLPLRRLSRRYGASLCFTELISAEGLCRRNQKTFDLMEIADDERPVGIQIFGKDADAMAEAAKVAAELKPDIIDINCGCCAPKVTSGGSGAALLKDPQKLFSIASAVKNAVSIPVSAKIRLGWDLNTKNYRETVSLLYDAGMNHITVHGRTRSMYYTGKADWENIAEIASLSNIPVIGNGDISSYEDAMLHLKASGCTAVMIGRKALGNPWIFSGQEPSLEERVSTAKKHFNDMVDYYGDYGLILARKHIVQYFHCFKNSAHIRSALVRAVTADEVRGILDSIGTQ